MEIVFEEGGQQTLDGRFWNLKALNLSPEDMAKMKEILLALIELEKSSDEGAEATSVTEVLRLLIKVIEKTSEKQVLEEFVSFIDAWAKGVFALTEGRIAQLDTLLAPGAGILPQKIPVFVKERADLIAKRNEIRTKFSDIIPALAVPTS